MRISAGTYQVLLRDSAHKLSNVFEKIKSSKKRYIKPLMFLLYLSFLETVAAVKNWVIFYTPYTYVDMGTLSLPQSSVCLACVP